MALKHLQWNDGTRLVVSVIALNLAFLGTAAVVLRQGAIHHRELASLATESLSEIILRDVGNLYEKIDQALLRVAHDVAEGQIAPGMPPRVGPGAIGIGQVDPGGHALGPVPPSLSEEILVKALGTDRNPRPGLSTRGPVRVSEKDPWQVLLYRPLFSPRSNFVGFVYSPLDLGQFQERFGLLKLGSKGSIGFRDATLHLLARYPDAPGMAGIGIPPDALPRIFNAFEQADNSTTRTYGGSGLGLAICKQLAASMGGTVGVRSTPGTGSVFHFQGRFLREDGEP